MMVLATGVYVASELTEIFYPIVPFSKVMVP